MDEIKVYCSHTEMRDPVSLVEHPRNYNTHPSEQIRLLAKIIKHQGWRNPITVSKRSGYVVKGHGRLAAAMLLKCEEVPIDLQDYKDEASELADMIADNRIAELAEADQDALKGLLLDETFNDFDVELTGFTDEALAINEAELPDLSDAEKEPFTEMAFILHDAQAETVKNALDLAAKSGSQESEINTNKNGNALAYICEKFTQWVKQNS